MGNSNNKEGHNKASDEFIDERAHLVQQLRREGIQDEMVLNAIYSIPRHLFLEEGLLGRLRAYEDTALPIDCDQTISQPYIVALMSSALCQGKRLQKVLEIGTGSGYQAAILSKLVDTVYTVERIKVLTDRAKARFKALRFTNIKVRYGDGFQGWPEFAPYDGIMVTAAPVKVPEGLLEQLAPGGRMIIPVGETGMQRLVMITREGNQFHKTTLEGVRFVPLLPGVR